MEYIFGEEFFDSNNKIIDKEVFSDTNAFKEAIIKNFSQVTQE